MIEALEADGPFPEHAERLMLFGRLVGSWDIEGRYFDEDGQIIRENTGEWHFGWILEGRVIQDVIISPSRDGREPGEPSKAYDTAIRAYDPGTDFWRVTVIAPIYGATVNLIAREHGDEIWLEGPGPDGRSVRWIFSEFTDERVRWQGFVSKDEGRTWVRDEEIVLHRRRYVRSRETRLKQTPVTSTKPVARTNDEVRAMLWRWVGRGSPSWPRSWSREPARTCLPRCGLLPGRAFGLRELVPRQGRHAGGIVSLGAIGLIPMLLAGCECELVRRIQSSIQVGSLHLPRPET